MLPSTLLPALAAVSAFLVRSGQALPELQPHTGSYDDVGYGYDNHYDYNPTGKVIMHYTAIGDSYASGVGTSSHIDGDNDDLDCRRSKDSYPYQFQKIFGTQVRMRSFSFGACAEANTEGVSKQIDFGNSATLLPSIGYDFGSPNVVSISVGSDTGHMLKNTIEACVLSLFETTADSSDYTKQCEVAWYNDYVTLYGLGQSLEVLFEKAMTTNRINGAIREVYVIGYPRPYETDDGDDHCPDAKDLPTPPLDGAALRINEIVERLNDLLRSAAEKTGATYVDTDARFEGHRICDKHCWFQTDIEDDQENVFRPNKDGYRHMMDEFRKAVLGPEAREIF